MSLGDEIKAEAKQLGVPPSTVEKDYVISIVLRELWMSGRWRNLIFKGGTALRKIYFPDYRFSEDMDFNLLEGKSVVDIVGVLSGMRASRREIEFLDPELRERTGKRYHPGRVVGYEIRLPYHFLRKVGEPSKIRMDVSVGKFERTLLPPVEKGIFHPYSDMEAFSHTRVMVYPLEEIMAEKIRAVFQRIGRPRDIYDIWYLSGNVNMETVLSVIERKFAEKSVSFSPDRLEENRDIFRYNWENLTILVGNIPDFEVVWAAVTHICDMVARVLE